MAWGFLTQIAIAITITVLSYMLMPKPKSPSSQSQNLREPTAEAGKPVPVLFGDMRIQSPNVLFYGDVSKREYEVDA